MLREVEGAGLSACRMGPPSSYRITGARGRDRFSGPTGTYVRLVGEVVMTAAIVRCWLTTFDSAET